MTVFLRAYGWKRLAANALAILALTYELGTPGHPPSEVICIILYLAVLVESTTHVWATPQKGTI